MNFKQNNALKLKKVLNARVEVLSEELMDLVEQEQNRSKKVWVRWIARKNTHGTSSMLLKELALEDVAEYKNCIRMSPARFNVLQ
ncbi:hypothetical protein QE152_g7773 [Popillia japonica]|uniref:Uncharacterized protein n=1 Tax=Popillia japonica TaxID=7064 RepID=A0AAW1MDS9_POPJA